MATITLGAFLVSLTGIALVGVAIACTGLFAIVLICRKGRTD
jgi:hypothetical protein